MPDHKAQQLFDRTGNLCFSGRVSLTLAGRQAKPKPGSLLTEAELGDGDAELVRGHCGLRHDVQHQFLGAKDLLSAARLALVIASIRLTAICLKAANEAKSWVVEARLIALHRAKNGLAGH